MTYKYLTTRELTFIYNFWKQDIKAYQAAKALKRSSETVYRVYRFLDAGNSISQFPGNHQINKTHCGRKLIELPEDETKYIEQKLSLGWTPDTIIG
ncbi:transposase [Liquorilactobacillus aquaticus DSM 21051]|uniref:Transposase n=1 Tax=Liquorilactobacillus aquaticus DSM 21051 TaxID=1423725 RepID=A0A0R2CTD9_9LACO|nr:transposase [Liquorilactobacillus aquaticus DSM 21051]